MEVSGNIFRSLSSFSGAVIDTQSHHSSSKSVPVLGHRELRVCIKSRRLDGCLSSGFGDDGHEKYYSRPVPSIRCGGGKKEKEKTTEKKMKKKLKLLKGLSKDLSIFSEIGFGLDPEQRMADQVKEKMISEAAELLLGQLQQLKLEEKELKRKKKEEKANLKAARMQNMRGCESSSESSSESSDSECGEVVDMNRLKSEAIIKPTQIELQPIIEEPIIEEARLAISNTHAQQEISTLPTTMVQDNATGCSEANSLVMGVTGKKIEVCMGGKCKKSGAALLLEEFQNKVGGEGSVVGCRCMGKCRDGPNVRVLSSINGVQGDGGDEYVRAPSNPLCIGVGLEDVSLIVTNFFGGNQKDLGLAPAS